MTQQECRWLYDHGLPFSQDLANDVINPCLENLNRRPICLIIDGAPGTGKTTLGVHIVDYINGSPMDLSPGSLQLAKGGLDLMKKSELVSKAGLRAIIFDEADINKKGAMTRHNKSILQFFQEYRSLHVLIILITQNISMLDKQLFEIGVVAGFIHLYNPQRCQTGYKVYDLTNTRYLLLRMDKMGRMNRQAYSITKGYQTGWFLNLPKDRAAVLASLSNAQKKQSRKENIKQMTRKKRE